MKMFVMHANADNYIALLNHADLPSQDRSTITKLLIQTMNELARDLAHLDFVDTRVAAGRDRVRQMRTLRDSCAHGSSEREQAERLLVNFENLQTVMEDAQHRLRAKVISHRP
jgi:hypothetical protein